jgi:hypothetical protein
MLKALPLLVLLALVSCSSKPTSPELQGEPTIVGMWHWKETLAYQVISGRWTPVTSTPATCGCTRGLRFTEGGNYERLENGNVVSSGTYTLHHGNPNYNPDADTSLWVQFGTEAAISTRLQHASLEFSQLAYDGPLDTYIR